jgi:hypothetical protein
MGPEKEDNNQVTCQVLFLLKKFCESGSSHRFPYFISQNENLVREMITDRMLLTDLATWILHHAATYQRKAAACLCAGQRRMKFTFVLHMRKIASWTYIHYWCNTGWSCTCSQNTFPYITQHIHWRRAHYKFILVLYFLTQRHNVSLKQIMPI